MKFDKFSTPLLAVSFGCLIAGCQTSQPEPTAPSAKNPVTAESKPVAKSKPQKAYQPKAPAPAAPAAPAPEPTPKAAAPSSSADYPIKVCIVSGETLGDDAHSFIYLGQTYVVSSAAEEETFRSSPADYVAKYQEALSGGSSTAGSSNLPADYPLTTCVVCGQELEDDAHTFVYLGETIVVASPEHEATFRDSPAEYFEKLRNASN